MLRLANVDVSGLDVDGLDQWETLQDPSSCKSKIIFYYSLFPINLFFCNTRYITTFGKFSSTMVIFMQILTLKVLPIF